MCEAHRALYVRYKKSPLLVQHNISWSGLSASEIAGTKSSKCEIGPYTSGLLANEMYCYKM